MIDIGYKMAYLSVDRLQLWRTTHSKTAINF